MTVSRYIGRIDTLFSDYGWFAFPAGQPLHLHLWELALFSFYKPIPDPIFIAALPFDSSLSSRITHHVTNDVSANVRTQTIVMAIQAPGVPKSTTTQTTCVRRVLVVHYRSPIIGRFGAERPCMPRYILIGFHQNETASPVFKIERLCSQTQPNRGNHAGPGPRT